ncbi:MAG: hypothetical protein RQ806_04010 [Erythrobacter sp.]|nr:hypothetical protein [Erythrobacter sp.]
MYVIADTDALFRETRRQARSSGVLPIRTRELPRNSPDACALVIEGSISAVGAKAPSGQGNIVVIAAGCA